MTRTTYVYRLAPLGAEPHGLAGITKRDAYKKARIDAARGHGSRIFRRDIKLDARAWELYDTITAVAVPYGF